MQKYLAASVSQLSTFLDAAREYLASRGIPLPVVYGTAATAATAILSVPILRKMSYYGARGPPPMWPSGGGGGGVPPVTDNDFAYITSQDLEDSNVIARTYNPRTGRILETVEMPAMPAMPDSPPLRPRTPDPDILIVKHNRVTYPLDFPAYSIGDGKLYVQDLRDRIAMVMELPEKRARRLKMLYKGKQLKDPAAQLREYGVKNNSEIMVVMPEKGSSDDGNDSERDNIVVVQEDASSFVSADGSERRVGSKSGKKSKKKSHKKRRDTNDDAYSHSHGSRSPRSPQSPSNLDIPSPDDDMASNVGSTASSYRPKPSSPRQGKSPAPPSEAMKRLSEISSHFTTALLPDCLKFSASPPTDPKKRAMEHRRLTETIMAQVLLQLDAVETAGEEEARMRRKALVTQVQEVLKGLDELKG